MCCSIVGGLSKIGVLVMIECRRDVVFGDDLVAAVAVRRVVVRSSGKDAGCCLM